MQRRSFLKITGITGTALTVFGASAFGKILTVNGYDVRMLSETVGIFTEKGGTIMFVESLQGVMIIDTQFPDSVAHLVQELTKKGRHVSVVINTHHHGDHSGGNIFFKNLTKKVIAHANAAINMKNVAIAAKTLDKQYFPTETFSKKKNVRSGKERLQLQYFGAAHTNGDIAIYHKKSGIIHVGDLVFNRRHPFVDRKGGANIESWMKVLQSIIRTYPSDATFVCGHAGAGFEVVLKQADIFYFNNYLKTLLDFTKQQISTGKTFKEILGVTAIPGFEIFAKDGIERPLTAAYEELMGLAPGTAK